MALGRATEADVPAMSVLLTRSITDLCAPDHGNDPAAIAAWVANMTEAGVRRMLANADARMLIAFDGNVVVGVGCVVGGNEIALNYVHPEHRFKGVSSILLHTMERMIEVDGEVTEARLKSTRTAHRFYLERGWLDVGPPTTDRWIDAWPMVKFL
jgi:GNAT superfamily N-acetyltransferase